MLIKERLTKYIKDVEKLPFLEVLTLTQYFMKVFLYINKSYWHISIDLIYIFKPKKIINLYIYISKFNSKRCFCYLFKKIILPAAAPFTSVTNPSHMHRTVFLLLLFLLLFVINPVTNFKISTKCTMKLLSLWVEKLSQLYVIKWFLREEIVTIMWWN